MADEEKIKEVANQINAIWAEINFLLSEKKKAGPQAIQFDTFQKLLTQKTRELRQLNTKRSNLNHLYSVILTGDLIEKDGGIQPNYPLNVEVFSTLDCGLKDTTRLSSDNAIHCELMKQLEEQYQQHFAGGDFTLAYIIQLK